MREQISTEKMEPNQESTCEPLKGQPNQFETRENADIESPPPQDHNDILYIVLIGIGIGFALPFYSFMMASEYWQDRFPGYSVAGDLSMTYIIITIATMLLNNLFLSLFSFKVRIIFGYIILIVAVTIVFFCEMVWHIFGAQTAFSVISVASVLAAIGCAIKQSSFYGFASMFPKKYVQAIMVGEGLAGFLAAITHIFVKLTTKSGILTIAFFLIPTIYIVFSCILYAKHIHIHSPFVHYYVKMSNIARRPEETRTPYFNRRLNSLRSGPDTRWGVARTVYPFMVCIALTFFVTVSVHPGIEAEIISCDLKSWMPILLMLIFTTSDVIGKVMALVPYAWSQRQLVLLTIMRSFLVVLLLLCCTPRSQPVISGETPAFIFTAALGTTNGLAASLSMMLAPCKVPATLKEATGNIMTFSYNVGIVAGMYIGIVFDNMRGPQTVDPCPRFPFIPGNFTTETGTIMPPTLVPAN